MASNNFVASKVSSETQRGRLNRLRSYITWLFEQFHDPLSVGEKLERNFEKLILSSDRGGDFANLVTADH